MTSKYVRKPSQQRGLDTRKKILMTAMEMISKKGFFKTNSKEIAKEAGVSIGAFYSYFPHKMELLKELFNETFEKIENEIFTESLEQKISRSDLRETVSLLIDALYSAHTLHPQFHREAISMIYTNEEIREINAKREEMIVSKIEAILQFHKKALFVSDTKTAAFIIYRSAEEVIHNLLLFPSSIDKKSALNELKKMISRYLAS